jgi:uncharacterized protein (TIGR02271 family)
VGVERIFVLGAELAVGVATWCVLHLARGVADHHVVIHELGAGDRHEADLATEHAGRDGQPLGLSALVVQVDVRDGADLLAVAVDGVPVDQGYDTSGPETDDAMTRSEEQIDVSTQTRQAGTARLRKWIETENVQMTVPIRREKARMVTEPVTDANRDAAMSGGDLTDEEHEVTLSEEVVDVSKKVVPKERVRLEKEVETEEVAVDEQVRKERIQMDEGNDDR